MKSKEDVIKEMLAIQDKCPHNDISNWTPIGNNIFVKYCLDCDKEVDRMEIE